MFLGVDIGTTGLKTCLVDREGRVIRKAYRKLRTYGLDQNKRELNPRRSSPVCWRPSRKQLLAWGVRWN